MYILMFIRLLCCERFLKLIIHISVDNYQRPVNVEHGETEQSIPRTVEGVKYMWSMVLCFVQG